MSEWTPEAQAAHEKWVAEQEAWGRCPYAGMTIARCWDTDLCDCSMAAPTVCPECHISVWDLSRHQWQVRHVPRSTA